MPGLQDINISVVGTTLIIKAERKKTREVSDVNKYMIERVSGTVERSFLLPKSGESLRPLNHFQREAH